MFVFLTGLLLSGIIAAVAWRARALTAGGAAAATIVGAVIYGFGGVAWAVLLVVFFLTSSILTRAGGGQKPATDRTGRTAGQVLANGIVAAALALAHTGSTAVWIVAAFAGAVAAATADTWATEIGLLSKTPPRLITTGKVCAPGQSGGITSLGTRGAIAGAGVIAVLGNLLLGTSFLGVLIAGAAAMFVDSVVGATLEGRLRMVTNDTVNLLTTTIGAVLAAALAARLP